jgi:hypothetical protein
MFGFSLAKFVVLVGLIVFVWYGFKLVGRFQEVREAEAKRRARDGRAEGRVQSGPVGEVEDTVKCRVCGAYVTARGATDCGQPGCPYGR